MKKYLLGSLFVLGTIASAAQENRVITDVSALGAATSKIPVVVTGTVKDIAKRLLIVEIKSAPSPEGTVFELKMPNLTTEEGNTGRVQGDFEVYVLNDGEREAFADNLTIGLSKDRGVANATQTNTIKNVKLDYSLLGGTGTGTEGALGHDGSVVVEATTLAGAKAGTYTDRAIELVVALTGQTVE